MATLKRISDLNVSDPITGNELVEVSQLSSTIVITGTTISAANTDNSYNDSGSGFITAGFAVGDRINVVGFANSGNNLVVGVVTAVTAGKLTIGGTDGDSIVDEAAGPTVTISKWTSRRTTASALTDAGNTPIQYLAFALGDEVSPLVLGAIDVGIYVPKTFTLTGIFITLTTAQTSGSILTIDVLDDGVSILSTKITVDNNENESRSAVTPPVISSSVLSPGSKITASVDQVGAGDAAGAKLWLEGVWS